MAKAGTAELAKLIQEGKELASKRPIGTPNLQEIDSGLGVEAACLTWFMKASSWIERWVPQERKMLEEFRRLDRVVSWGNMLGTEFREIRFRQEDMLSMIGYLDGVGAIRGKEAGRSTASFPLAKLHAGVKQVAEGLFRDGHYAQAIFEAFKLVNLEVKSRMPGEQLDGKRLMARAFNPDDPRVRLNSLRNTSERDEQEGFMLMYMGAMQGIRNPKAHDSIVQTDPNRAFEYLCLASLLLRRLEDADEVKEK